MSKTGNTTLSILGCMLIFAVMVFGIVAVSYKEQPAIQQTDEEWCIEKSKHYSINHLPAMCIKYLTNENKTN
jgi:hypothetical protein